MSINLFWCATDYARKGETLDLVLAIINFLTLGIGFKAENEYRKMLYCRAYGDAMQWVRENARLTYAMATGGVESQCEVKCKESSADQETES